ncbi:MAG: response regulator, partial [Gammaproteobacteria bacterium]|nr:response regulator [Gammaproteobacteria bacterium]
MSKIKVLVVDDSAVIRQVMTEILKGDSSTELDAAVADPIFAMKRMELNWPDVIVLDVEMPRMDGITFLKKIMAEHPTPVVMCSTLTASGTATALEAMTAGAVDIITKPKVGAKAHLLEENKTILNVIKSASKARNLEQLKTTNLSTPRISIAKKLTADAILDKPTSAMTKTTESIVAIGTSTGGTQALEVVLTALPKTSPGIVIVQH